jgi:uncharacterized protein
MRAGCGAVKAWIDIENAPQVQYLSPLKPALEQQGHTVVITARRQGLTLELLGARGITPVAIGGESGSSKIAKLSRLVLRAIRLALHFVGSRPDLVIAASRPADLASWLLRIPSFQFTDYEYADDRISRLTGAYLVHPDVINPQVFVDKGLRRDRLVPFAGLKEAISFSGVDFDGVEPLAFEAGSSDGVHVLVRPPGESTHYFVDASLDVFFDVLAELARRDDVHLIYTARYPNQVEYLDRFEWRRRPTVLSHGVPFVSLLTSVDAVISSGGTMVREAAYLGVPAFSILRSGIGQVDHYLESLGRLRIIESGADLPELQPRRGPLTPLPADPDLPASLVESLIARVG